MTAPAILAGRVRDTLATLLTPGEPVALLDFPNHMNVGDSAIWLGERALLRSLGVPVAYMCDQRGYVAEHLRAALPAGTILLHGGGNFGDLYPRHQRLRERVVQDFPDRRIVQLPQTVEFEHERNLDAAARRFGGHERFTLLVRDALSLERYGPLLARDVRLCPDSALGLGRLGAPGAGAGVLWLARADGEARRVETGAVGDERRGGAAAHGEPPAAVRRADWPSLPAVWRRRRTLSRALSFATSAGAPLSRPAAALFDRLAGERVAAGAALLSSARVVVTDRLHGHILALLCGVPHVLLDSRTGKVRRFHEAWTAGSALWADDPGEALRMAREARMSAAYVVLAHKQPQQVARLCAALAPAPVFLHVDAAAGDFGAAPANAWPLPRHRSGWASWGIVAAVLEGMRTAALTPGWTHLTVLSGQDYPLCPQREITAFLARHEDRSFMARWPLPSRLWGDDGGLHRLRFRHWALRGRRIFLPLRRELPAGIEPWGGSMHACLARRAVSDVLGFVERRPDVARFYRRSWIPDEQFVPTAVMNSPARVGVLNESLSYIRWSDRGGRHPDVLRAGDLTALAQAARGPSDVGGHGRRKLFARKLDAAVDPEIFDLIDEQLLQPDPIGADT